jgi:hypothetical protein
MSIYVYDGLPRAGKTALIVNPNISKWLKEAAKEGRKIFSNTFIYLENIKWLVKLYDGHPEMAIGDIYNPADREDPTKIIYYWRNIDTWNYMKRGRIICSEGTRYFNARRWAMLSEETEIKLQQHGKDRLDIYVDTQHWSRLDVSLRVLVQEFTRVERVIGWSNTTYLARYSEHSLENLAKFETNPAAFNKDIKEGEKDDGIKLAFTYFMPWKPWRKPLYNTEQEVGHSIPMPLKHIERSCPDPNCKLYKKPKIMHA